MAVVSVIRGGTITSVNAEYGQTLESILRAVYPDFAFPCGGNHTCGKCLVQVKGHVSPVTQMEHCFLPDDSRRLACCVKVLGDCTAYLPQTEKYTQISRAFSAEIVPGEPLFPGDYSAAIDIGTTTIVSYLFANGQAEPLAIVGQMNVQRTYGSDVLSRIVYCDTHTSAPLMQAIRTQIGDILSQLCQRAGVPKNKLAGCCITGNTTMLHFLTGLDPHGISVAPFVPASLFGVRTELDFPNFPALPCFLPPCISAYIGADISCSILASGIMERSHPSLLIDVGTNGEIVLCHNGRLYCCSTAAGPAFEGAAISCGMPAQEGAIDKSWRENDTLCYHVIGGKEAKGICGSGLIDIVAVSRRLGTLDKKGRPIDESLPIGDSGISLTRRDLSELLLAKAAIRAGIDTLLHASNLSERDMTDVVLCGGFGSYLSATSAADIGLLYDCFVPLTRAVGNAAGAGAGMILQNRALIASLRKIGEISETINLSCDPFFKRRYISAMCMPDLAASSNAF